ncbi:MAG: molybdopterin-synthase adenylyltransferase MoeB [Alphaproteobacteria bacterium]|nr:molybdopterin-synthase adenylyltransferase MoeB [Alphaproteobacteria bacterium]
MLTDAQLDRYARHLILPEVGGAGQQKLLASRVLAVGAGGLGAPVLLYLAAAGVGTLGVIDDDDVDVSNLQRQVVHSTDRIGRPKAESAAAAIRALDPAIGVETHNERLTEANAARLFRDYDLILDGSDNFATRYLVNNAAIAAGRTLVSGAVLRFDGQVSTFKPHAGPEHPCYRCLFPEPPPPGAVPACSEAGILGAVAGVVGTLMAVEALKELIGIGDGLSGRLLLYDALSVSMRMIRFKRRADCPACGG